MPDAIELPSLERSITDERGSVYVLLCWTFHVPRGLHMAAPPGEEPGKALPRLGTREAKRAEYPSPGRRSAVPGCPLSSLPDELVALTELLVSWYPFVIASGGPSSATVLDGLIDGQVSELSRVEASLAHDIGFIVAHEIRKARPDATWEMMEIKAGPEVTRCARLSGSRWTSPHRVGPRVSSTFRGSSRRRSAFHLGI